MKKFITLALVLVMALSLAAPALAFTNVEYDADADTPIELSAKIVDVAEGYVSVNFTAAPTNRGYVKNEVVCMVATMYVPKDVDPSDDFDKLVFSGTNVSVWQDENFRPNGGTTSGGGTGMLNYVSTNVSDALVGRRGGNSRPFQYAASMATDNEIFTTEIDKLYNKTSNQTYHFAIFGKVLADGAYMNAALKGSFELTNGGENSAYSGRNPVGATGTPQSVGDYTVLYWNNNKDDLTTAELVTLEPDAAGLGLGDKKVAYLVYEKKSGDLKFAIITHKDFTCEEMWVYSGGQWYEIVGVLKDGFKVSGFEKGIRIYYENTTAPLTHELTEDGAAWTAVMKILRGTIRDDFKLDPTVSGQLKPIWWKGNNELFVEVAIEPWYAEVTVPPEIQIDPPKTGDAMNILGFVLIALAGLAVVAVRKVRA